MALKIDFMCAYDLDSVAAELRRIAAFTGRGWVTTSDIESFGRICPTTVATKFGTMRNANESAGLVPPTFRKWTTSELVKVVIDLWTRTQADSGRSPCAADVKRYGLPLSSDVISKRFGGWKKALVAASHESEREITEEPKTARPRSGISPRTRFIVFKRDLYTCRICRRAGVELVLDHLIPVSRGGSDDIDNLQALCVICNQGKGGSLE
jgi:hypothetical protein